MGKSAKGIDGIVTTVKAPADDISWTEIVDRPTIPAAQVQSDWNASSGSGEILNKPNFANVATSGSYNDLSNVKKEDSFEIKTSDFNAVAGGRYGINTTSSAITVTLSASPTAGDAIFFADMGGVYSTNNLTIAKNGNTIMGFAEDLTVSTDNKSFGLCWNGTTWRIY